MFVYGQDDRSAVLAYLPLALGLTASAVAAWFLCPGLRPQVAGLGALFLSITYIASTVASGTVALVLGGCVNGWHRRNARAVWQVLLPFWGVTAWMTPVLTFYGRGYQWAATAAVVVLAALGSKLIYDYHVSISRLKELPELPCNGFRPDQDQEISPATEMFAPFASTGESRDFMVILGAVASLQATVFAQTAGASGGEVLLLSAAAGVMVSCVAGLGQNTDRRRSLRKLFVRTCGSVALVSVALTSPAMVRLPVSSSVKPGGRSSTEGQLESADLVSGFILVPQSQRNIKLVAPMPLRATVPVTRSGVPPALEFTGEYWILPMGQMRPPEGAVVQRATPTEYNFKTVDRSPLMMLGKQRLHASVSMKCCDIIRVRVRNLDQQPDTIALQVNLLGSTSDKVLREPLGSVTLPASEFATVDYDFPSSSMLSHFEQIEFYFHLLGERRHRSANVAIAGFEFTRRNR